MFMKFLINCALACAPPLLLLGYCVYAGSPLFIIDIIWTLWAGLMGLVLVFASHYMKTEKEQTSFAMLAGTLAISLLLMAETCGLNADIGIQYPQASVSAAWTIQLGPRWGYSGTFLSLLAALLLLAMPLTMPILRMLRMSRSKRSGRLKALEMVAGNMAYASLDLLTVLIFLRSLAGGVFFCLMLATLVPATSVAVGNLLLPRRYFFFPAQQLPTRQE